MDFTVSRQLATKTFGQCKCDKNSLYQLKKVTKVYTIFKYHLLGWVQQCNTSVNFYRSIVTNNKINIYFSAKLRGKTDKLQGRAAVLHTISTPHTSGSILRKSLA